MVKVNSFVMYKRVLFFTLVLLFSIFSLSAQSDAVPYYQGFELSDSLENAKWELTYNPYRDSSYFSNLWCINSAVSSEGDYSLYVSSDSGESATYVVKSEFIIATREFDLPSGEYDLAFDYKVLGDDLSKLYIAWVPESDYSDIFGDFMSNPYSAEIPNEISSNILTLDDGSTYLSSTTVWKQASAYIKVVPSDGKFKLTFAWNNATTSPSTFSAAIDNIMIFERDADCSRPSAVQATADKSANATVWWKGNAESYDLRYKTSDATTWTYINTTDTFAILNSLQSGVYEFNVRSVCDNTPGIWVEGTNALVYTALCIDYLDLESADCRFGSYKDSITGWEAGAIDYGYAAVASHHTIHYMPGETDSRTNGELSTVPSGEAASVRLGTWQTDGTSNGGEMQSISYDYMVDTTVSRVLAVKYAIVLQDPDHGISAQPYFRLQIFDQYGVEIDPDCAGAFFYAQSNIDGWTTIVSTTGAGTIVWKDWTTIGVNLDQFHGQKIQIKLTTRECTFGAHWAYAYFTLDCLSGNLSGINCGETPTTEFVAPEGFKYRWYTVDDDTTIEGTDSTTRILQVDPDDITTFLVDIIYPENSSCYFTLEASAVPRWPQADCSYNVIYDECKIKVQLINESYVRTMYGKTSDKLGSMKWDFDFAEDSYQDTVVFDWPNDGLPYTVNLLTSIYGTVDTCYSDTSFVIQLPIISDTTVVFCDTICEGDVYEFGDTTYTKEGVYYDYLKCYTGCDSISEVHLTVLPIPITVIDTTYCSGGSYIYNNITYAKAGTYTHTFASSWGCDSIVEINLTKLAAITSEQYDTICAGEEFVYQGDTITSRGSYIYNLETNKGCDSIVTLYLDVLDTLDIQVEPLFTACADDEYLYIAYDLLSGTMDSVEISFSEDAKNQFFTADSVVITDSDFTIQLPSGVRPNKYDLTLLFYNGKCGALSKDITLDIYYPSSVVEQKWNNTLAVLNDRYNGGYIFSSYQWYLNSQPIKNAVSSYYYLGEGLSFSTSDQYQVLLTRADDGISAYSCVVQPVVRSDTNEYLTIVTRTRAGAQFAPPEIDAEQATARIFSISGALMSVQYITSTSDMLVAPYNQGIYLVEIQSQLEHIVYKLLVE